MPGKFERARVWGCCPQTVRGYQGFLEGEPSGKNFVYVNQNNVLVRNIEDPSIVNIYNYHSNPTTCAKYAPSGYYVASGDDKGNLKIWDPNNPEAKVREYRVLGGAIKDIAWTEDSKRVVVVGEGAEKCGAAIMFDTGASCGKIDTIERTNSCDIRQKRPYRAIAGTDGKSVDIFKGPPFTRLTRRYDHTNWVQKAKYAPNGELFASGGSDGKLILHGWDEGEIVQTLGEDGVAHKGTIYGLSWSSDSKQIFTSSADKTAKIWDVETGKCIAETVLGDSVGDQQYGCLLQNNFFLSLSFDGTVNYIDPNAPAKPCRMIKGHQKPIKSLCVNADRTKVFAGSYDGVTTCWEYKNGVAKAIGGKNKPKLLTQIDYRDGKLSSVGSDDSMRLVDEGKEEFDDDACALDSQPRALCRGAGDLTVVAGIEKVTIVRGSQKASVLDVTYVGTAVDIHPNQSEVAIGAETGKIYIYSLSSDTLTEKTIIDAHTEYVTRCRFSPDGEYLAACSSSKEIELYKVTNDYEDCHRRQYRHAARVTDLAWSPDSKHYATSCLDGAVSVWNLEKPMPMSQHKVHGRAETSCVAWLDDETIVTGGGDACLRTLTVTF
ncbi:WD repeat-containing protein 1-B-like [Lytechinus pictus]|uniref:WD repeat-containing protein 1-B-like n=1 Tax=Lytechinus pictus TaxID=7653 RepID=UPI0030B9AFD8